MVGVFGGSGFYSLFDEFEEIEIEIPYGVSSAPVALGEIEGRKVAFMPRHGARHELPPAQVPYRANVWAMREVGVTRLLGPARLRVAPGRARARRLRRLRPVRRPDGGEGGHLLRGAGDDDVTP